MPSKNQYDLVQNDDYDTRIPLHPDEAFHHGITFQAKYIGTLDVARPTSRVEIVAAMRRIRYEFKAKGIKKKKVTLEVSVEGLRVTLRKKKKKKQWLDDKDLVLMHHPIYRIFYVSHDSQDLKIFSYIARDGSTNVFKCSVFKSNKKSQAMRVVRTVGQAFEVCHKLSVGSPTPEDQEEESSTDPNHNTTTPALNDSSKQDLYSTGGSYDGGGGGNDSTSTLEAGNESSQNLHTQPQRPHRLDILPPPPHNHQPSKSPLSGETVYSSPASGEPLGRGGEVPTAGTPLSAHHEMQLLREQLDQQCQQTQAAVAQIHLLRDQLAAETAARLEAQARIHQLLVHNKELLDHISSLVQHLQEQEKMQGNQAVQAIPQEMQGMYFPELEGRGLALLGTPFYLYQDQSVLRGTRGTTPIQGYYPAAALYPSTSTLRRSDLSVGRASSEPAPAAPPPQSPPSITTTLASLGLSEDPIRRSNAIQRSTSEKVPNRSELMSQVQRTAWARHTTK